MADKELAENIPEPENPEALEEVSPEAGEEELVETPIDKIKAKVYELLFKVRDFFAANLNYFLYGLAVILLVLFVNYFIELKHREKEQELIGYVKINHKIPKWYKDKELPDEAKEHLENYRARKEKTFESYTVIHDDKNKGKPVLGKIDDKPLDNKRFFEILATQGLGRLTESTVEKPEKINLSGYDLSKFDYKYFREFIGSDLRYTNFSGIKEKALSFRGASLTYAQFVDSIMPHTNFIRTYLSYANFYNAVLDESSFIGVVAEHTHFNRASMTNTNFTDSKIKEADLSEAKLDNANFKNTFLAGTNFNESSLKYANFKNAQLQGASFVNADLEGADFRDTNLEGADLSGANLKDARFTNADVTQTKFANARNATFKQLQEVQFLLSARSIPQELIPKKKSWLERFSAPHELNDKNQLIY